MVPLNLATNSAVYVRFGFISSWFSLQVIKTVHIYATGRACDRVKGYFFVTKLEKAIFKVTVY